MSDQTVMLSEKLIEVSPFDDGRVFYTNSGSEANDTLVKMLWFLAGAEGRPERRKILTRMRRLSRRHRRLRVDDRQALQRPSSACRCRASST